MSRLILGEAAPWFTARTPSKDAFAFGSVGGRYVLLIFAPPAGPEAELALALLDACCGLLDDINRTAFVVLQNQECIAKAANRLPGLRFFLDPQGEISQLYGMADESGRQRAEWLLLDPSLRIMSMGPVAALGGALQRLSKLGAPADHAGTRLTAPVLIVPRIFEPDICRRLIDHYENVGGQVSGVMREIGGKTVGVLDDSKRRRDADISDEGFRNALAMRIRRRLAPEIRKAFQFEVTRMERYIVACYDADEGGYFRAHRDNTTKGTAHRRFACSINLNAEDFEGGELRFPEYGPQTYRPPTGGAVVFSCSLLHEATPVTKGRRYAFLPFFYDEAAAAIREANLHHLEVTTPAEPRALAEASA